MSGIVYLAWTQRPARQLEIAQALGATPMILTRPRLSIRALVPLRYVVHGAWSLVALTRRNPDTVIVTNPPVPAAAVAALYCAVRRRRLIIDSHPAGFGAQGDTLSSRLQFMHRWAVRRAHAVLVTTESWRPVVEKMGSKALMVHEPCSDRPAVTRQRPGNPPIVLFVCIFAPDEPVAEVIAAARSVPEVTVRITGDTRRAMAGLLEDLPANVELTGYLDAVRYQHAVDHADVILALTTEPTSVMRAGYEAVNAERPLIVSDWPDVCEAFPFAVGSENTAEALSRAIRNAVDSWAELMGSAPSARDVQVQRWAQQLRMLRQATGVDDTIDLQEVPT